MRFLEIQHVYINGIESKQCSKCKEIKSLEGYCKRKTAVDGLDYVCKECKKEERKKYQRYITNSYHAEAQRRYRQRHKEKIKAYKKSEHGKLDRKMYKQRRRHRDRQLISTLSSEDWNESLKYFNNRCAYCGGESELLEQEHVVPSSKGGHYTKQNIVPSCRECNLDKLDKDIHEWYLNYHKFSDRRYNKILRWTGIDKKSGQQLALF